MHAHLNSTISSPKHNSLTFGILAVFTLIIGIIIGGSLNSSKRLAVSGSPSAKFPEKVEAGTIKVPTTTPVPTAYTGARSIVSKPTVSAPEVPAVTTTAPVVPVSVPQTSVQSPNTTPAPTRSSSNPDVLVLETGDGFQIFPDYTKFAVFTVLGNVTTNNPTVQVVPPKGSDTFRIEVNANTDLWVQNIYANGGPGEWYRLNPLTPPTYTTSQIIARRFAVHREGTPVTFKVRFSVY